MIIKSFVFPARVFFKQKYKMAGDCCDFKFLGCNVDGTENLMRFRFRLKTPHLISPSGVVTRP